MRGHRSGGAHCICACALNSSSLSSEKQRRPDLELIDSPAQSEGRLLRLAGYMERLALRAPPPSSQTAKESPLFAAVSDADGGALPLVSVWRAEVWWEGLFSVLFWALGFLESEALGGEGSLHGAVPTHCYIDWTDERLCFHRSSRQAAPPNAWLSLFETPPPLRRSAGGTSGSSGGGGCGSDGGTSRGSSSSCAALPPLSTEAFAAAAAAGRVRVSVCYGRPAFEKLGGLIGADRIDDPAMRGGRLDDGTAARGRQAVSRWLRVRPPVLRRASWLQARQMAGLPMAQWLAVHVRRSDKLVQCPDNGLPVASVCAGVRAYCSALGCRGVFVCSCDAAFKAEVSAVLAGSGLAVASLEDATLPKDAALPPHMDGSLDVRQNAEDVLVEVLVMARCQALLCTWSHVSVGVVYFSPPGFRWFMFGETPPLAAPPPPPPPRRLRPPPPPLQLSRSRPPSRAAGSWRARRAEQQPSSHGSGVESDAGPGHEPRGGRSLSSRRRVTRAADACRWLVLFDGGFELLAKAISPPWGDRLQSGGRPAEWAPAEPCGACGPPPASGWEHRWLRCRRSNGDGAVMIHHLVRRADAEELCTLLRRLAAEEAAATEEEAASQYAVAPAILAGETSAGVQAGSAAAAVSTSRSASNVGGFHGTRDLWTRPSFAACGAARLLRDAVELAACAEGAALGRPPLALCDDERTEAWFNQLPAGGWNTLHTHPGRIYSVAFFVDAGSKALSVDHASADGPVEGCLGDRLGGRLALIPSAPRELSDEQRRNHVLPSQRGADDGLGEAEAELEFLLVDPVPGSCVVFPSCIPHFVIPAAAGARAADGRGEDRLSVAINF